MADRIYNQTYLTSYQYVTQLLPSSAVTSVPVVTTHSFTDARTGVVGVKGYKSLIALGGNASTTPYSTVFRSFKVRTQATGRVWVGEPAGFQKRTAAFTGYYPSVTPQGYTPAFTAYDLGTAKSEAYVRFARALKAKRQHMSGMTFLGEFRETVRLLLSPGRATQKYFSGYATRIKPLQGRLRLARLDPKRVGAILREAGDLWLEVSFGVRPMLADIKDLAEAIARWRIDRLSPVVRGSSGGSTTGGLTSPPFKEAVNWLEHVTHVQEVRDWRYTVYGRLHAEAQLPACGSAAKLVEVLGFRAEDFLPTVYELAPFSFLLDYFTNLGGVLEAASVDTSWVDWANEVRILKGSLFGWTTITAAPGVDYVTSQGDTMFGSASVGFHATNRRSADFSSPTVVSKLPGMGPQFVNMLALLTALRRNRG
jgi:hypothetical protein